MNSEEAKLVFISRRIELQIQKLDQMLERWLYRDKAVFARVVDAITKKDQPRFNVFSNELAEVRKQQKQVVTTKFMLQIAQTRIGKQTSVENPDHNELTLCAQLLKAVQKQFVEFMPEVEYEINEIYNQLSGVIVNIIAKDVDRDGSFTQILKNIEAKAENDLKEKLPSIPEFSNPKS